MNKAAEVASQHHAGLFRWALTLSRGNDEEAMEIVQQTYLEVLEGRAQLLSADDPKSFLFGIARKVAASRRRRRSIWGRILRLELGRTPTTRQTADPESDASHQQQSARIKAALKKLEGRQLEMVNLVFIQDMTVEQAAQVLGISAGSARTHYHRAKQKLSRLLEESESDE